MAKSNSTELATTTATEATPGGWSKDQVELIRSMCAKDATDDEFKVLLHMADKYSLDPLARQIYLQKFWNYKDNKWNPASIIITYTGMQEIANRDNMLDGINCTVIRSGTKVLGARSELWKKGCSHPFVVEVEFDEYYQTDRNGKAMGLWATKPITMIKKVANAQNLRQAFSLSGLYAEEEMPMAEEAAPSRPNVPELPLAKPDAVMVEYAKAVVPEPEDDEPEQPTTREDISDRLGRAVAIEGLTGVKTCYDSRGTWLEVSEADCAKALAVLVPGANTIGKAAEMLGLGRFGPIIATNFPDAQPPRSKGGPAQQYAALLHFVYDYQLRQEELRLEREEAKKRLKDASDVFGSEALVV